MRKINFIEVVYLERGFLFNPDCAKEDGTVIGEIDSNEESFRLRWDEKFGQISVDRKDKTGNWQNSEFITYHQKKIDSGENIYSVTIGDHNGKMLFKGIFEIGK
jgi:hypothetical protein